jgi:hypothetical protein
MIAMDADSHAQEPSNAAGARSQRGARLRRRAAARRCQVSNA